jgi:hypothetical protein
LAKHSLPARDRKPINRYLTTHAEPEVLDAARLNLNYYKYCLVIPAFQEDWQELQKVWGKLDRECLIILVINAPTKDEPLTSGLISDIEARSKTLCSIGPLTYLTTHDRRSILLVDRCSNPIPEKQGVGLARKIGADIALTLINNRRISEPWIFNTDADVRLPESYFAAVEGKQVNVTIRNPAAILYPFTHRPSPGIVDACTLYEISLYYYVCGLRYAASHHAFTTVGSTIAIHADHYAMVRGFPRRSAGEDFYLLNKLAKTGTIVQLTGPLIEISGRLSERVPFGTGVGIKKILHLTDPVNEYPFYNPRIFRCLKHFLRELDRCQDSIDLTDHFKDSRSQHWCESVDLFTLIHSKRNLSPAVFKKFASDWMDGFRTLKFIHFIQQHYLEPVSLGDIFDGTVLPQISPTDLSDLNRVKELVTSHRG